MLREALQDKNQRQEFCTLKAHKEAHKSHSFKFKFIRESLALFIDGVLAKMDEDGFQVM